MNENQPSKAELSFSAIPGKALLKMQIRIILVLLGLLLIGGCGKKNQDKSLRARIVEHGTGAPIAGAGVLVHHFEDREGLGGAFVPYDSVVTDANGSFFIDGSTHDPAIVKIYTEEANYYDQWLGGPGEHITEPFRKNPVIKLYPFAWARIRFIKETAGIDYINVARLAGQVFGFTIYSADSTVIGQAGGNTWNSITIYPYSNGQALPIIKDSIHPVGHDTSYFEIRY